MICSLHSESSFPLYLPPLHKRFMRWVRLEGDSRQALAQNRVSSELKPDCSGLYLCKSWKNPRMQHNLPLQFISNPFQYYHMYVATGEKKRSTVTVSVDEQTMYKTWQVTWCKAKTVRKWAWLCSSILCSVGINLYLSLTRNCTGITESRKLNASMEKIKRVSLWCWS